ncbi:hypothetical protein ABE527_02975 [Brucella sp. TWI432]
MKRTIFIVGNGPVENDLSAQIDAADLVLRFNEPRVSRGMTGTKTDMLMLATSSKQMEQWIKDPAFINSDIVRNAPELLFAFHPSIIKRFHHQPNILSRLKGRRADWTNEAIDYFGRAGKKIRIMPSKDYFSVCEELGITPDQMKKVFPSTGFFGIWLVLRKYSQPDWEIKICGFSWEGWKRHDWAAERKWIEEKIAIGHLHKVG